LYCRFFAPNATEEQRVFIGRVAIVIGIFVAGYFGVNPPGFVGEVVAFAFGLAAASFFPAIFLGIFSKRVNRTGAVLGMSVGLIFTLYYIVACTAHKVIPMWYDAPWITEEGWWLGISPQGIGTVGMVLNFVVTLAVSSVTAPPPPEVVELIESVRVPAGSGAPSDH
jgi:cation/acetate symporter